jgi:hypothetical protein
MALNNTLVKGASLTTFDSDPTPDGTGDAGDVLVGTNGADVYAFNNAYSTAAEQADSVGDKIFNSFGFNDTLLASSQIFDENSDGYIVLGDNARFDVERSSTTEFGTAQFNLVNENAEGIAAIRELGSKGGDGINGYFAYADASTRVDLINALNDGADTIVGTANGSQVNVVEGTVGNDTLSGTSGTDYFLYDTALGLNLGRDKITGFGIGDRIATTTAIYDSNGDGSIGFGSNKVLDLPGAGGALATDPKMNPGGQISVDGTQSLTFFGAETVEGHTYYLYGLPEAS